MSSLASTGASNVEVHAVVVAFNPEKTLFVQVIHRLSAQVNRVHVIDNTPSDSRVGEWLANSGVGNVGLHAFGENLGIAVALNEGIRQAIAQGATHVLLSDQDSIPDAGMVPMLAACCEQLSDEGVSVGCVCPEYFDRITGQPFPFQVLRPGKLFYSSVPGAEAKPWIEIIASISSGALIPRTTLQVVGSMLENFFIDDVDTEWCHRARAFGFHNFGTAQTRLTHQLGDAPFRVWYLGWRGHSEYSPVRLYYRFRNFILLCRLPHVPWSWALRASWNRLGVIYAHCLFARGRRANLRAIVLGLWDGFRGRSGKLQRSL